MDLLQVVPKEARRGHQSSCTRVSDGCELDCVFWEVHLGPLEQQPYLQPLSWLSSPLPAFVEAGSRRVVLAILELSL